MINPEERAAKLGEIRNHKMARSAHAYVRGNTVKFYDWLASGAGTLPDGPAIWICGDCHLGNLGPLADPKGRVAVQIRDLDQTVIGNPAHDLIRLGLSLASAARSSDLPGVTTARIIERLVAGYEAALGEADDDTADRSYRPRLIQRLLRHSIRRRWKHIAAERLEDIDPEIPLGRKYWPLAPGEKQAVDEIFGSDAVLSMITSLDGRKASAAVEVLDAAYWVKGCSSLGRLRYAVMVRIGKGKNSELALIDIKEAVPAAAPRAKDAKMPRDNAVRVVTGARALSPNLGDRMVAARLFETPVVLRELMPQDLKIEAESLSEEEAVALANYLASVVGRAHGRQMDRQTRTAWHAELTKARSSTLDAPSWLWKSVVELLTGHEAHYLEHCRLFALAAERSKAA